MSQIESLPLTSIMADDEVQPRCRLDNATIKDYADDMERGEKFPRWLCFGMPVPMRTGWRPGSIVSRRMRVGGRPRWSARPGFAGRLVERPARPEPTGGVSEIGYLNGPTCSYETPIHVSTL